MKKTLAIAALSVIVSAGAQSCEADPTYDYAEPVGDGEQCFSIERETPEEEELGIYCLPGVDPSDVRHGGGTGVSKELDD